MGRRSEQAARTSRREAARRGLGALGLLALLGEAAGAAEDPEGLSLTSLEAIEAQKYPWGWIRWLMNGQIDPKAEMTLGVVQIEPKQANPVHLHPNSAEYLHVLSGTLEHRVGERWVTLKAGDTLRVPKGVVHGARTGEEGCRVLVVYNTPARQMVVVEGEGAGKP